MTASARSSLVSSRRQVVVVGSGFAGFFAARKLARAGNVDVTVLSATDGMLYQPLLPDVAVGTVDPRSVVVPLASALRGATLIRGHATGVDFDQRLVRYTSADGGTGEVAYDRLLLAPGSITRCWPSQGLRSTRSG